MKHLFTILAAFSLISGDIMAESSMAESYIPDGQLYAKYMLGVNQTYKNITSPAMSYGVALGYEMDFIDTCSPHIEAELFFRNQMPRKDCAVLANVSVSSALINVGFTVNELPILKPFFGIGIGYAEHQATIFGENLIVGHAEKKFAYHFKGGVKYAINDNYHVSLEYKYLGMKSFEDNHGIYVGLVQYF